MKFFLIVFVLFFGIVSYGQTGRELYLSYCSACHGQQLQGGRSPALVKSVWLNGNDKKSIIKSITYGIAKSEMTAWNEVLSKKQIKDIAEYIISMQVKSKKK